MQQRPFLIGSLLTFATLAACEAAPTDSGSSHGASEDPLRVAAITEVTGFGSNPGNLKMYEHAPEGLPAQAPLVLVLHGCTQRAADVAQVGWNELADASGFVVVYPEQQPGNSPVRCFSWAAPMGSPDDVTRGKGENESIRQMVAKAAATHDVDPKRIFVTGFSAGAGMAIVLAATWPEVFAGAASFAGLPFGCASTFPEVSSCMNPGRDRTPEDWGGRVRGAVPEYDGPRPRIGIWQGTTDNVVSPNNRRELRDQWTNVLGVPESPTATETVGGHAHETWKDASGAIVLETWAISGMSHGIPVNPREGCGRVGQYAIDKGICGAKEVARFFGLVAAR